MRFFDRCGTRLWLTMIGAVLIVTIIYLTMCAATGVDSAYSAYNSYELQARAWLNGQTALDRNYEHLELAVYNGNYYVSFPPVPSVPEALWILIFASPVPFGIFQKVYATAACLLIIAELMRRGRMKWNHALLWGISFCFAGALLPITLVGGVWFEAQSLAFLLCASAVIAMRRDKPTLACMMLALAVGCRPFTVCLGPVLLVMYIRKNHRSTKSAILRLIPGIIVGMTIACVYMWYNSIRFGNPFEFGHSYLPEFQRAEHGQFSFVYIPQNIIRFLFGSPFTFYDGTLHVESFGFSMFLSNPILICGLVWMIRDIKVHRMSYVKWSILIMSCINLLLLLMHRTVGGVQFGMRYSLELVPFTLAWYFTSPNRRYMRPWEAALMTFGLVFNMIGGICVHV